MKQSIALTKTDREILESYKAMLDGLSDYIGPGYEIVLHSLENFDRSAIKVINGHFTARKEGAPLTDLALEMLARIEQESTPKHLVYFNTSKKGTPIRSTTIPILGLRGRIIGLLCMNFYTDITLNTFLENLLPPVTEGEKLVETFAGHTDELILSAMEEARILVMNDASISSTNKNKAIVNMLHQKGIFNLKDAVIQVADGLGVSKNTVYLHLRSINGNGGEK